MNLVSQGGEYGTVSSHYFDLVQRLDLGMDVAKVGQYLVSGLEFTGLQEFVEKHYYS